MKVHLAYLTGGWVNTFENVTDVAESNVSGYFAIVTPDENYIFAIPEGMMLTVEKDKDSDPVLDIDRLSEEAGNSKLNFKDDKD